MRFWIRGTGFWPDYVELRSVSLDTYAFVVLHVVTRIKGIQNNKIRFHDILTIYDTVYLALGRYVLYVCQRFDKRSGLNQTGNLVKRKLTTRQKDDLLIRVFVIAISTLVLIGGVAVLLKEFLS